MGRSPLLALVAIVVLGVLIGVTIEPSVRATVPEASSLVRARQIADTFAMTGDFPATAALVSDMRLADPATSYQTLRHPFDVPANGSIGVFASGLSLWLRRTAPGGRETLRQIIHGSGAGTYGPYRVAMSTLPNGDFDTPLAPAWTVQAGRIASVSRAASVHLTGGGSLRVTGTGRGGPLPTTVTQTLMSREPARKGSEYLVGLVARTRLLSRPVSVELRLNYRGGSFQFFLGTSWSNGSVIDGIPPGTTHRWVPVTIRAVAAKAVTSAVLFLIDTGVQPLSGTAWVDEADMQTRS